ncbi:MAG: hypothetical protein FJ135_01920 [Deltaproteobacteria bacterium]|nr:hypothetical protein [Deltaproteobacteria bacterium]
MAKYRVKPGYCLHLPHQNFVQAGEEADLNGELEKEILESQGWKIEPVNGEQPNKANGPDPAPSPEAREVPEPPKDRAVKKDEAQAK